MKAARLHRPRDLRIEEVPEPKIESPDEVLVRVHYVGVCGSDVHYYRDGTIGGTVMTEPLILGHEPAGEVVEVGSAVTSLRPGDRVCIDPAIPCGGCEFCLAGHPNLCRFIQFFGTPPQQGAYRELLVHREDLLFKLPPQVSTLAGAVLEVYGIAIHAVDLVRLKPASDVAVIGAGPIGLATAQIAKLSGALRVFVLEPIPERREMARKHGADEVLDPHREDAVEVIREQTGGLGVDVAFEAAGEPETPQLSIDVCKNGGTVALIGIPYEDEIAFRASSARRKGLTIRLVRRMKNVYPRAIRLAASGAIDPEAMVTHVFPLERIAEAFELVVHRRHGVVKAMIEVSRD